MRLVSHREFDERTIPIIDWEFDGIDGIEPDTISGRFSNGRFEELIEFCSKNPEFHIVSIKNCTYFNKPVPGATSYRLAIGSCDPSLTYIIPFPSEIEVFDDDV